MNFQNIKTSRCLNLELISMGLISSDNIDWKVITPSAKIYLYNIKLHLDTLSLSRKRSKYDPQLLSRVLLILLVSLMISYSIWICCLLTFSENKPKELSMTENHCLAILEKKERILAETSRLNVRSCLICFFYCVIS